LFRRKRKESFPKRLAFALFYRLLKHASAVEIPLDAGIFSLMDRKVVELLRSMPERNRYISGLRAYVGGRQVGVEFERDARFAGMPRQTFGRLLRLGFDALFSFSYLPLKLATFAGFLTSMVAFVVLGAVLYFKLFTDRAILGWASTMSAILFLGGVQLITLGILGEYIGRIYDEAKERPYYVVARRWGFDEAPLELQRLHHQGILD